MAPPVMVPRSAHPTVFCNPTNSGETIKPMPAPIRALPKTACHTDDDVDNRLNTMPEHTAKPVPTSAVLRKPIRMYRRADNADAVGQVMLMTASTNPAATALRPSTCWAQFGKYTDKPIIIMPAVSVAAYEPAGRRRAHRCRGKIGSGADRSTAIAASAATSATANVAMLATEFHAQAVPPCNNPRMRAHAATITNAAPR